jgi:phage-related protein
MTVSQSEETAGKSQGLFGNFPQTAGRRHPVPGHKESQHYCCDLLEKKLYFELMSLHDKPLVWLHGEIKTPPFSRNSRLEVGFLLRRLQKGEKISLPHSRPMPSIGPRCHELRINDENRIWRIVYRVDSDAIVIAEVFEKKTNKTPKQVIGICQQRLKRYDAYLP